MPNRRGKFLLFESNHVRLNNNVFPAEDISVSLNAALTDAMDIDGDVIGYSPNGPLQGSVSFSFDLTGQLPDYFYAENLTEQPTVISFNTFVIYGHLQSLNYSIEPYQPIKVNADFAFFHGIKYLNTYQQDHFMAEFDNSLKSYNGVRSYLLANTESVYVPISFNYSLTAKRTPYTKVGYESPTRVALEGVNAEMNVVGNNIDKYMSIRGNEAHFVGVLNDLHNPSEENKYYLRVDGKVVGQSFDVNASSYGTSQLTVRQTFSRIRNITSIPFIDSDTIYTTTADRVYEAPDFTAVCPNIIRKQQPVPGGGGGSRGEYSLFNGYDLKYYIWYDVKIDIREAGSTEYTFNDNNGRRGIETQVANSFSDRVGGFSQGYPIDGKPYPFVQYSNLNLEWKLSGNRVSNGYYSAGKIGFLMLVDTTGDGAITGEQIRNGTVFERLDNLSFSDLSYEVILNDSREPTTATTKNIEANLTVAFAVGWKVLPSDFGGVIESTAVKIPLPNEINRSITDSGGKGTFDDPIRSIIVIPLKVSDYQCPENNANCTDIPKAD